MAGESGRCPIPSIRYRDQALFRRRPDTRFDAGLLKLFRGPMDSCRGHVRHATTVRDGDRAMFESCSRISSRIGTGQFVHSAIPKPTRLVRSSRCLITNGATIAAMEIGNRFIADRLYPACTGLYERRQSAQEGDGLMQYEPGSPALD